MPTILSTKKLRLSQKQLLLNAGISLVEYDAIETGTTDFDWHPEPSDHLIFTSKKAVKSVLKKYPKAAERTANAAFCVGRASCKLLSSAGIEVKESANYSGELAQIITRKYRDKKFVYFCGNKRRTELPSALKATNVEFSEIEVYKTDLKTRSFGQDFDGILFFSPSGVQSFFSENKMEESVAFCIGDTTASEAKNHTRSIVVANKPSIENVIVQVVKYFRE